MDYNEWEPLYRIILKRFGFSEASDLKTAEWLSTVYKGVQRSNPEFGKKEIAIASLKDKIADRNIVICGNAPTLETEFRSFSQEAKGNEIYIAADGAATVLIKNKKVPDVIVTDLDGKHPNDAIKEIEAADKGALLLIHAHGDNEDKLEKYMPAFLNRINENAVIPTCQCRPPEHLFNFGGFTDGDRCVFLADEFGAATVTIIGFDFEDPNVKTLKKKKLECAEQLIQIIRQKNDRIKFFSELE
ncbi:hypothetical protein MmiHf6_03880 [Methanimicrococcus hongohii]|uniref:6-hydroxymethyl-7,8-dihydropterin pyrophosphokinase n=1 Tax=Methanimicrococcus hongohii TaxID=3028295 RepID=A0AA96ZS66_9EURY|nr:6-hydroxymethylpterin diphosphokinase MptE-like protein [Methanimicrococcus sp. Hf6]WNY23089.1 hypothetical protein MmiHf6_03880 [Methanimicrococcus sp. Hf6]